MKDDWKPVCSLPEEIKEQRRGAFKLYRVDCGWWKDNKFKSTTYHVKDPEGKTLKSFDDLSEASIYAGKQYSDYLDELEKQRRDEG